MKQYRVLAFHTGVFSKNINPQKLEATLNEMACNNWSLRTTICETTRMLLFFKRETHILIFERDQSEAPNASAIPDIVKRINNGTRNSQTPKLTPASNGASTVLSQEEVDKILDEN